MIVDSYLKRIKALQQKLFPPPKPEVWLPTGILLDEDENFLPGQEAIAERCERAGIIPNVYIGFNPDDDGCETA